MDTSQRLVILDSMALLYRAHFALYKHPRFTPDGLNTSPILGFTNTLLDVKQKLNPTHLIATFDSKTPTWRHQIFTDYKAKREAQPEAITTSIPYLFELLEKFSIPTLQVEGQEADDLMAALSTQAVTQNFDVFLVTPDKDLGQLVNDRIKLYKPPAHGKPGEIWGPQEVQNHWGITNVTQIQDMIALWGDASDNIPGVPGIGKKRAQELLKTYHSLEKILASTAELTPSLQQKLNDHKEEALRYKKLATVQHDIPLSLDWEEAKVHPPQKEKLLPLFEKLDFRSLAKRLFGKSSPSSSQLSLFGNPSQNPSEEAPTKVYKQYQPDQVTYQALESLQEIKKLLSKLQSAPQLCIDTETTGLNTQTARLLGIALSTTPNQAYYLPYPTEKEAQQQYRHLINSLCQDPQKIIIGHNLKYDLSILQNHHFQINGTFFDTYIAHHLLVPEKRHSLDALAQQYLDYDPISITSLIGEKGKNQKNMADVPLEKVAPYACEDVDLTLQLYHLFKPRVEKSSFKKLFETIEMPLIPVLADIEHEGIALDLKVLDHISEALNQEIKTLEETIFNQAGNSLNLDSPKQLGHLLFDQLKIVDNPAKTPKGQYITNEAILSKLHKKHPIIAPILTYREVKKLKSTYVDKLGTHIAPQDQRLHTTFQQGIVSTGRLSSANPNLQNIPIRTARGRQIRKAFVARDAQHTLFAADYSQIELRLMAHFSNDPALLEDLKAGKDVHTATAARVFQVPPEKVDADMRRQAKMINFSIIYGVSSFGLGQRLDMPTRQAHQIITTYFSQFPQIKNYMDRVIAEAKENGYVETLMGRRRYLTDINSRNATTRGLAERNAINMPIQGTAAEIIKRAMVDIQKWLQKEKMKTKMVLQIHDELLFDVPHDEVEKVSLHIPKLMEKSPELNVPLVVTLGKGKNWLEAH